MELLGKTTTVRAVRAALGGPSTPKVWGNSGTSVARAILRIRPGESHSILEIGIGGPNEMNLYPPIARPDIVVVTAIGSEHNRSFGTLERTRNEKAEMLRQLPPDATAVFKRR